MPDAWALRLSVISKAVGTSIWAGESAVNTLHMGIYKTSDMPGVSAGPVTLPSRNFTNEGGSYTATVGGVSWTVERGWAIAQTADTDGFQTDILNAWRTMWSSTSTRLSSDWAIDSIRMYPLNALGKMATLSPCIARPVAQLKPTGSGTWSPDIAVCCSLYTALRTKRGRGRMYMGPLNPLTLATNGTIASADRDIFGGGVSTFLTDLRDIESDVAGVERVKPCPVVLHRAQPYNEAAVIQTVRVGDEIDIQERRTKGRPETFTDYAVT